MTYPEGWKERFWSKVDKSAGPDECWPWTGGVTKDGHGRFCMTATKIMLAHRVARGCLRPTPGKKVHHLCGNPRCCNPKHLRLRKVKFKSRKGENAPSSHLTAEKVLEIRRLVAEDGVSYTELAERYGVRPATIGDIVRRKSWKHI